MYSFYGITLVWFCYLSRSCSVFIAEHFGVERNQRPLARRTCQSLPPSLLLFFLTHIAKRMNIKNYVFTLYKRFLPLRCQKTPLKTQKIKPKQNRIEKKCLHEMASGPWVLVSSVILILLGKILLVVRPTDCISLLTTW